MRKFHDVETLTFVAWNVVFIFSTVLFSFDFISSDLYLGLILGAFFMSFALYFLCDEK